MARDKRFSDVIDKEGNQYIDIVMEGGGVLGIALVGYTYGLEEAGIRFRSTGGTSAGAINALLLQALGTPNERTSERMLDYLANMPMTKFQDGGWPAKFFVKTFLRKSRLKWVSWLGVVPSLLFHIGFHPGEQFHRWLTNILKAHSVDSWRFLKYRMRRLPSGLVYAPKGEDSQPLTETEFSPKLKIVSAELTTTTKVVLPERDGALIYKVLDEANPADFARASMSVPFFFRPFRVKSLPKSDVSIKKWRKLGYLGKIPEEAIFVDGGIVSNFPVNLFHVKAGIPKMPTFGVKLGVDRDAPRKIEGPLSISAAMINVMRFDSDSEYIRNNSDFKQLVKEINTGHHFWLNFELSESDKLDLFIKGLEAARDFLQEFNWDKYKISRKLATRYQ
ncbi:patatin-like phospholipase family protein [Aestuariibacter sp. AA17]|uniref:Patatin-like phospholipase family protein n=2 Tax=Fluctibacter corallii TaxID=2984329 RepID=A0ABT3A5N5_9ALTE|nr:patatin-like phospholipase family protein [Aestuariibacter sp. AA17]